MNHPRRALFSLAACVLLLLMALLAGGSAWRESVTVDEVSHIAAGVSYLQKLDLRLNEEHPPLPKILAALPLVLRGAHADYSHISWTFSESFFPAYAGQWVFGEWFLTKWNDPISTLRLARLPMLLLMLLLGMTVYLYARRLGGEWAGLLCLAVYITTPAFLTFGPLVHTDIAVTLFSLITLWRFAEIWREPNRKNAGLFALAFAAALLSKFTAGILLFVFVAFALSTRFRALPGQPSTKPEARAWRRLRWRFTLQGILLAAVAVYTFYFIFSVNQSTDALNRLGHGAAAVPFRRLLMPAWLYLRGVAMVLITGSRPTFILGRSYTHGVWFYFPVVFVFKSALGFLGLLLLTLTLALKKNPGEPKYSVIPVDLAVHWRVLRIALLVFTGFCLLSRLTISIRHFTLPIILLILTLAALPRMLEKLEASTTGLANLLKITAALLLAACLFTALRAYPFYFPYINAFGLGRPAYTLVSDSNLDWNQSLPEVRRFAEQHGLQTIALDEYGFNDPAVLVPQATLWNCQTPSDADAGQWVAVSVNMILDGHNCAWLALYPHQSLAGGSMYAIHLPDNIPAPGSAGGPPLPAEFRNFGGVPFDMRSFFRDISQNPERLPAAMQEMQARFARQQKK
jgi:4-amino-4-deoxy-L-arabinose transferase-like glycosyltransferase